MKKTIYIAKTPMGKAGSQLLLNTTDASMIKIDFGHEVHENLADEFYCRNLKITIEEVSDEDIRHDAIVKDTWVGK